MAEGTFTNDDVQKYLAYTVKIFQLGERFMWEMFCNMADNTGSYSLHSNLSGCGLPTYPPSCPKGEAHVSPEQI